MKIKKNIKTLCVLSGVVMSTSVFSSQFVLEKVKAEEIHQLNTPTNVDVKLEKSTLSRDDFIKALIEEYGNITTPVFLHKLGLGNVYKNAAVKLKYLYTELPQNISFVTVNGRKIVGGRIIFMDKEDEVVNTESEYNELFKKYSLDIGKNKKIHTALDIKEPTIAINTLKANGLFLGYFTSATIDDIKIHSHLITPTCDFANFELGVPSSVHCDFNSYKENDNKIIQLIKDAGIK